MNDMWDEKWIIDGLVAIKKHLGGVGTRNNKNIKKKNSFGFYMV